MDLAQVYFEIVYPMYLSPKQMLGNSKLIETPFSLIDFLYFIDPRS